MRCCSVPSWGDDWWLPGQINSAGSDSKNNTLTQICAHFFSYRRARAQAQSRCLFCFFRMLCVPAGTETWALEPRSLQLSRFSPCFLSLSLPLLRAWAWVLGLPSAVPREAENILPRKHTALLLSQGASGDRGVRFLSFACCRGRTSFKRESSPHV